MKTYSIFLASSYELQPEREKFENFISRQNNRLAKKNMRLRTEIWEDMGAALNNGRKQDDYNKILNEAEIVVVLFWTKMGKYTSEEFELAYKRFLETGKPSIYVFEKTVPPLIEPKQPDRESKKGFIDLLQKEGKEQFQSTFEHYEGLLFKFHQYLIDWFDQSMPSNGSLAIVHSLKAPHSPSFVIGREKNLETISEKLGKKGKVVLISGEGGMGKTTLAAKYWHLNKYAYGHVAYFFCGQGILNAMMDDGLKLTLQGMDELEKIMQIQRKFNDLGDDVLLLLDNANDADDISNFLNVFSGFNGSVLITSRCRDVLVNTADEINLTHLDPEDAKSLFRNYYSEESDEFEDLLERLLKGISYHTLLTEVFAKNLKEASEMGTNLKSFLKNLEEKGLVLDSENNFEVNTGYDKSVQRQAATVNDILEILYDFSSLSEEDRYLLVNLALLPSDSYSLNFLLDLFVPENKRAYRDSLKDLFRKGWVGGGDQQYRLSPVIQQLVLHRNQESLWEDGKDYLQKLTDLINNENDKDNAHTKFKWIPFGRLLVKVFKDSDEEAFSMFLNELAILLWKLGGKENLVEAKGQLEKALASDIRNFGEDSPAVAKCRSILALVLQDLGGKENLVEAKGMLEKALASDIRNFGEDSPAVAISRSNLALVLIDLGGKENLVKAKGMLEKALASDIRNFGKDSPAVAIRRSNLAMVLKDLGGKENLVEGKGQLEKALASDIRNFGKDSPAVAIRRSNLAMVLKDLGGKENLVEGKGQLEKALASDIRNFGEDSPAVATCRSNLANVFAEIGGKENLVEAKGQLEKALASDIRNFGEDSPAVARCRSNLALVLKDLTGKENLVEAKGQLEKALASDIRNFGEDSPAVATCRSNLANVFAEIGGKENLVEAKRQLEKALASDIRNFGEDSPAVAISRSNLALVLQDIGGKENLVEAKRRLEKALASFIRNFKKDSPAVARCRSNLAMVLKDLGGKENLVEAKGRLEKALASFIRNFKKDSPAVARCRSNLAMVLKDLGGKENLVEAKGQLEKALASYIRNFGEDSPAVATSRSNLALVLQDLGGKENLVEAKRQLEKALASDIRNFKKDSPAVARCRSNLAMVLKDLGGKENLVEAKGQLEKALASYIRNFGEDSPAVATSRSNLALVLKDLGGKENLVEAKGQLEKALASDIRNIGEESPSAGLRMFNLGTVLADIGNKESLWEAKKNLERAKEIYIMHFTQGYQRVIDIQRWIDWVDKKLYEMEDE